MSGAGIDRGSGGDHIGASGGDIDVGEQGRRGYGNGSTSVSALLVSLLLIVFLNF